MSRKTKSCGPFAGLGLPSRRLEEISRVEKVYPAKASKYYLSLADPSDPRDPILAQCAPDIRELESDDFPHDGLGEEARSPVPRLVRKYNDRAALLVTSRCVVNCRFCFRKRRWRADADMADISDAELRRVVQHLKKTPEIREILVTGGDPLTLKNDRLAEIIGALKRAASVDIIRVCTRMPVVNPARVDNRLAKLLGGFEGLWVATHFNHPRELTPQSAEACARLVRHGVPVVNQTVLLKGVNDSPEVLEELFHIDPVKAVRHFSTGVERGLEIMRVLRGSLSFLATPAFAIDLPDGGGKVVLTPESQNGPSFEAVDGRKIKYRA